MHKYLHNEILIAEVRISHEIRVETRSLVSRVNHTEATVNLSTRKGEHAAAAHAGLASDPERARVIDYMKTPIGALPSKKTATHCKFLDILGRGYNVMKMLSNDFEELGL
ncbi:hypothetical protein WN51_02614 [Melipona quadrifasciata]|uniref:Uncharacterized protein n=1 Tax=Melipona quadrifasciata TaxID=166423 RepID=A0A0N0U3Y6_9HYME|nr:hypothetical protein WN51_02614 [Melipona quadrifasciata]